MVTVYPEPSSAVVPVRNVGDGFLFATVQGAVRNAAGELWYKINYGEYVNAEDLDLVDISEFTGFEVKAQPERVFGWMIVDYWFSAEPDTKPEAGTPKLPRYTFIEVFDAVEADDGWIWYNIGSDRWMRQAYLSLVGLSARQEEVGEGAYWHDRFVYKHSHGCVNMPPRAAEWEFNWPEKATNDLWIKVYSSDPRSYLNGQDSEHSFAGQSTIFPKSSILRSIRPLILSHQGEETR